MPLENMYVSFDVHYYGLYPYGIPIRISVKFQVGTYLNHFQSTSRQWFHSFTILLRYGRFCNKNVL